MLILYLLLPVLLNADHIRYNINIEGDEDWYFVYEKEILNDRLRTIELEHTLNRDSFVYWILEDLAHGQDGKSEILFYVHGMWGGQNSNFRRAYYLLDEHLVQPETSDIARIVSLKWPGNDFDYKKNKKRVYSLAPFLAGELTAVIRNLQLKTYVTQGKEAAIDMVAHSLGNELIKEMMLNLEEDQLRYSLVDQMIWTASDLDIDIFDDKSFSERLASFARGNHFYFSERDLTLEVSKSLNDKDRLGRGGPNENTSYPANVYFVDVTLIKDENNFPDLISGHSYYRSSPTVTADMLMVLSETDEDTFLNRILKPDTDNVYVLDPSVDQP